MLAPQFRVLGFTAVTAGALILSPMRLSAADPAKDGSSADDVNALNKARVALAQKAYAAAADGLRKSTRIQNRVMLAGRPEDIHTWSLCWLEAQQDQSSRHEDQVAALEAHFKRMTELRKLVRELEEKEILTRKAEDEAEWYRLEAQAWLAKAKAGSGKTK
jgi:hypothetical protein